MGGERNLTTQTLGWFLVRPIDVEFWQGRPNRLHDRIRYQLQANCEWKIDRLAP